MNEITFWKVIHNKYLFNKIIELVSTCSIEYNHINKYYLNNRILFKNFNSLKWLSKKQQFEILIDKLKNNQYIHISKSSVKELFDNCKDKNQLEFIIKTLRYNNQDSLQDQLEFTNLINTASTCDNIIVMDLIINKFKVQVTSSNIEHSLKLSKKESIKYLVLNYQSKLPPISLELSIISIFKNLNFTSKSIVEMVYFILENTNCFSITNPTVSENQLISFYKFMELQDRNIQRKLLHLEIIQKTYSTPLWNKELYNGTVEEYLLFIEILFKLYKINKYQIEFTIPHSIQNELNKVVLQDNNFLLDEKEQLFILKTILVRESKQLFQQYLEEYDTVLLDQLTIGIELYNYSFQVFNTTGLKSLIGSNKKYWFNYNENLDSNSIILKDQNRVIQFCKLFFSSSCDVKCENFHQTLNSILPLLDLEIVKQLVQVPGIDISYFLVYPLQFENRQFNWEQSVFHIEQVITPYMLSGVGNDEIEFANSCVIVNFTNTNQIDYYFEDYKHNKVGLDCISFNSDPLLIEHYFKVDHVSNFTKLQVYHKEFEYSIRLGNIEELNKLVSVGQVTDFKFSLSESGKPLFKNTSSFLSVLKFSFTQRFVFTTVQSFIDTMVHYLTFKGNIEPNEIEELKIDYPSNPFASFYFSILLLSKSTRYFTLSKSILEKISSSRKVISNSLYKGIFCMGCINFESIIKSTIEIRTSRVINYNAPPSQPVNFYATQGDSNRINKIDKSFKQVVVDRDIKPLDIIWLIDYLVSTIGGNDHHHLKEYSELFQVCYDLLLKCDNVTLNQLEGINWHTSNLTSSFELEHSFYHLHKKSIKLSHYIQTQYYYMKLNSKINLDYSNYSNIEFIKQHSTTELLVRLIFDNLNQLYLEYNEMNVGTGDYLIKTSIVSTKLNTDYDIKSDFMLLLKFNEISLFLKLVQFHLDKLQQLEKDDLTLATDTTYDRFSQSFIELKYILDGCYKYFKLESTLLTFIEIVFTNYKSSQPLYEDIGQLLKHCIHRLDFIKLVSDKYNNQWSIEINDIKEIFIKNHINIVEYLLINHKNSIELNKDDCISIFKSSFINGNIKICQLLLDHYSMYLSIGSSIVTSFVIKSSQINILKYYLNHQDIEPDLKYNILHYLTNK